MVKDSKFAAEPTADSTADAKKDRKDTEVTTTENVVQPTHDPKAEKEVKNASGSKEDKMYQAHVKGVSIQSIADEMGVDAAEVRRVVEEKEGSHTKASKKNDKE